MVSHVAASIDPDQRPFPPGDNRWQRGRVIDAVYLADSPVCAWAEWYRHLAEAAVLPAVALPRDLWRYQVAPLQVPDLSDIDRLVRAGLPSPHPGRRGWPAFQAIGEQIYREQWPGLLAPSAARPANHVLAVFLPGGVAPAELVASELTRVAQPPVPPTGMRT